MEGISEDRLLGVLSIKEELQTPEGLQNAIANKVLHYLRDDILRYNDATILFYQELPLSVLKAEICLKESQGQFHSLRTDAENRKSRHLPNRFVKVIGGGNNMHTICQTKTPKPLWAY